MATWLCRQNKKQHAFWSDKRLRYLPAQGAITPHQPAGASPRLESYGRSFLPATGRVKLRPALETGVYLFPPLLLVALHHPSCPIRPRPALVAALQLSQSVLEQDVSGFVLSLSVQLIQPFLDEASARHVLAKQQQQQQPSEVAPVSTLPPVKNPDLLRDADEVDRACLDNAKACGDAQKKSVLPEMLRLEGCLEK